jgi:hypothetical protein
MRAIPVLIAVAVSVASIAAFESTLQQKAVASTSAPDNQDVQFLDSHRNWSTLSFGSNYDKNPGGKPQGYANIRPSSLSFLGGHANVSAC